MSTQEPVKLSRLAQARLWFSPWFFLSRALAIAALFWLVHLAGLRENTTFLSGTVASAETGMRLSQFYGMIYILLYLGCVVVAPIFALAAGVLALWEKYAHISRRAN